MPTFIEVALSGLIGSSLGTAVFGALFLRRNKHVESEIKAYFDESLRIFESRRTWKQQCLSELLGPLQMQFERTKRAFDRWNHRNLYLEANVVREGNETIRSLLLAKGHLIPPHLMEEACRLVEHYEAWLEAFDRVRNDEAVNSSTDFVFVGPDGYPFPTQAESRFKAEFRKLQSELYGVQPGPPD